MSRDPSVPWEAGSRSTYCGNAPPGRRRPPIPEPLRRIVRRTRRLRAPRLTSYAPVSMLELPDHTPDRAGVTAIDFHTHLGRWLTDDGGWMEKDVGRLLDLMDAANVSSLVNLDGRWGRELEENLDRYDRAHPGRFFTFCHLDWRQLELPDGPDALVRSLQRSVGQGARGLKVWKDLGLRVEARGRSILPDDELLRPVWQAAGALGIPVLIHVADPLAFFHPADRRNERLEELLINPRFQQHRRGLDLFHRLIDALECMVASNPGTMVVAAHGCYTENLARVSELLAMYPNLCIDIAARANDLGRQPHAARALLLAHPDRVLFGTDIFPLRISTYRTYFRLLETEDDAFPYSDDPIPINGRWQIYGLGLPHDVLQNVYADNARTLLERPSRVLGATRLYPSPPGIAEQTTNFLL
jgi:predicted TIM-barrel fold metal-dependent hydrolase